MCRDIVRTLGELLFGTPGERHGLLHTTIPTTDSQQRSDTMPTVEVLSDSVTEFCTSDQPVAELVFFHGFQFGNETSQIPHLSTWTKKSSPSEYWPQTLFEEKGLKVRALTVSYDASKNQTSQKGRMDLYQIAENLVWAVTTANVGRTEGIPVILIGHCFGGLVIKEFIIQAANKANCDEKIQNFLDNLGGVFFYSTPHLALKAEVVEKLFPKERNLHYSPLVSLFKELNKHVARLQATMQKISKKHGKRYGGIHTREVFELDETDLGFWKGMVIAEGSGRSATTDDSSFIKEDHINVCRPDRTTSDNFLKLLVFIDSVRGSYIRS